MFCALLRSRYQVSVYRTNGPLVFIIYNHNSSQIELSSLSFCLIPLVAGVGGKLSRAVYLAPHLGIES